MIAQSRSEQRELLKRVHRAAEALKSHFGADRVILFGSLVDGERFSSDSDVDLAAEGLDAFDHWDAWWLCEEIVQDRRVDFVPLERAGDALRNAIEHSGVEV